MLEHMLSTHAHICLVPIAMLLNTIWKRCPKQFQQLLQAMLGSGKDKMIAMKVGVHPMKVAEDATLHKKR